jgi:hypothetical protein
MSSQSGFQVLKLFHPTAMVSDLWEIEDLYRRVFGVRSTTIPYTAASRAYRSLTVIADCCIENISAEQTHLSPFRMYADIVGNHWYFPCFYVADMQDALYHLHHRHRVRLTESGTGNPVTGVPPGGSGRSLLFTHPADTGIMWEFWEGSQEWYENSPLADPRMRPGWKLVAPSPGDPIGIEALSHLTIVAHDPSLILKFLTTICGGTVIAEDSSQELGSNSVWVCVGAEPTLFEIAMPKSGGARKRDLERVGNTPHSLCFKVRDLSRTRSHLAACGIAIEVDTPDLIVTNPDSTLGLPFGFASAFHISDPRRSISSDNPHHRATPSISGPKGTQS